MKILIADDDPQLLRALRITLTAKGYEVIAAPDGTAAVSLAVDARPDLIMLDLGMPGLDGVEVIQAIRGWSSTPILVVSGRTGSADKVEALDVGADDYITKPFAIDELLARLRALSRRIPDEPSLGTIAFAGISVDFAARRAMRGDRAIRLTPTEWRLLELLVEQQGRAVSRESLLDAMWGPYYSRTSSNLRFYIAQLRKKLEPEPREPVHIVTADGSGYRFELGGGIDGREDRTEA
ncbi:two-component system KDP operon response regulator KdpE [Agrococcus sp. UYP10]|uniref:response regulator transcription factor n=1 Tax=Agrococcus sp. UYP10 TaxID=1756355 RepID=UPI003396634E